jgi:hypothetical protein
VFLCGGCRRAVKQSMKSLSVWVRARAGLNGRRAKDLARPRNLARLLSDLDCQSSIVCELPYRLPISLSCIKRRYQSNNKRKDF